MYERVFLLFKYVQFFIYVLFFCFFLKVILGQNMIHDFFLTLEEGIRVIGTGKV